jgi:hypothetical protein
MAVELSRLMQLAMGQLPALQMGDLPRPVAEYLKCHPAIVWLGPNELTKIARKHGDDIKLEQLQCMPFALRDGEYYTEDRRPNCVTIIYRERTAGLQYTIGLKAAGRGSEVWVQTFHRIDDRKAARRRAARSFLFVRSGR